MSQGQRYDVSPLGPSQKVWVAKVGGLPLFIRAIAHALIRDGHSESDAIQLAVGVVQRWAAGNSTHWHGAKHVSPETQAKAAAAVAQWEAMKAAAHVKSAAHDSGSRSSGDRHNSDGSSPGATAEQLLEHLGTDHHMVTVGNGAQKLFAAFGLKDEAARARILDRMHAKDHSEQGECGAHDEAITGKRSLLAAGWRDGGFGGSVVGEGSSSGDLLPRGIPATQAKAVVDELSKPHAFRGGNSGACAKCGQPAGAAVHHTSAHRSAPDAVAIPPVPREADSAFAELGIPHAFRGKDPKHCSLCQMGAGAAIHHSRTGKRHAGPGHDHVPTGHAKGNPDRIVQAAKVDHVVDSGIHEAALHQAMTKLFKRQRNRTLTLLQKQQGQRAEQGSFNDETAPSIPGYVPPAVATGTGGTAGLPDVPAAPPPGTPVDPSSIFDPAIWAAETAKVATPIYDKVADLSVTRVHKQLERNAAGVTADLDGSGSLGKTRQLLAARANKMAAEVTDDTFKAIKAQLDQGHQEGESIAQLGDRVKSVFDQATTSRARTIARTETLGAMDQAGHEYAAALPTSVVAQHTWRAHHDARTRPAHRAADGQARPIGQPFTVGPPTDPATPMLYPHDPAAPANLTVNCRCIETYEPGPRTVGIVAAPAAA